MMTLAAGNDSLSPFSRRQVLVGLASMPALGASRLAAAQPQKSLLSGAALKGDIQILRDAYTALHPGLYRSNTPAQMAKRFSQLEEDWGRDQNLAEAYLSLSRFAASLRCGHSYANFYNQSRAVEAALFTDIPRLPFLFRWLGTKMVITANQSPDPRLLPGTEVDRINGQPVADILASLLPYARADGGNDAKRRVMLEVRGEDDWDYFDIFYGLLNRHITGFEVVAHTPDGRAMAATLPSITLQQRRASHLLVLDNKNAPQWTFEMRGDVGLLTMPGWALYNSKWDWEGWLNAQIDGLVAQKAKGLIVDLRDNEGGLDCGDLIIARLIDAPIHRTVYQRRVRFRRIEERLRPYLDTWDRSFDRLGEDATDMGNGFYRLPDRADMTIEPKGPKFQGKLVVLTEAMNSSATHQFAQLVKREKLGILVGQPTGGNLRGINGGAFYFLRLPASGLEIDLPLIGTFPETPQPDSGVLPDIAISPTAKDIARGTDSVLNRALDLIA